MTGHQPLTGIVTFLFTDVAGSTTRWEQHPETMRVALARHDEIVRTAIETHGGLVFATAGDQFCAAFSVPADAVRSAVDAQLALVTEDWGAVAPFEVRMALTTGTAEARGGDYFGPPLNRCARLLAITHPGQVLAAEATARLLADIKSEWSLLELGEHKLRDLERPERVFQIVHPRLTAAFPALKSESDRAGAAELLADARQALALEKMRDAYEAYVEADRHLALPAEDLRDYARSAWWTGRIEESMRLRERAYAAFLREQRLEEAALLAIAIAEDAHHRLAAKVSEAWTRRAAELLEGVGESPATGRLLRWQTVLALDVAGDRDQALDLAEQVIAIGRRLSDRNLEALGLQDKGRILVAGGHVREGLGHMDQAMVAAVGGELDVDTTGRSYCNMLNVCDQIADYGRAREWSSAAAAWCEDQSESAYPGICRIYRAELDFLQGSWERAADQTRKAADELSGMKAIAAVAAYQLGVIELRSGRLDEAEHWFNTAHESGHTPLPGLAALRLAAGDVEAARELLAAALSRSSGDPFARGKLLPTWIEVQVARGELDLATEAIVEVESLAEKSGSSFLAASAYHWRGVVALMRGDYPLAVRDLEQAIPMWTELDMPYEGAQSRLALADALHGSGSEETSRLERRLALNTLERLGAPVTG